MNPRCIAAPTIAAICAVPPVAVADDLSCRSDEGGPQIIVKDYDGTNAALSTGGQRVPLELLNGGTDPIWQGQTETGDLFTLMLNTQTGRYGFNIMNGSGIASMDAGTCGRVR
ncbi:hypothetical protein [Paracoccus sp. SCSIO 75233]|uniref:hypothetical protein n=1 Tax=Paracoccus sp. SCSIO 75233 TaxID=3017782 RepID=UPI0022F0D1B3|nr:hypothetical protein [Paracoccus sp. SCSIO 75233]WBU52321.1 hypothetical protein PAF12_10810 [Paracoccus sp. SCSIO 75233]